MKLVLRISAAFLAFIIGVSATSLRSRPRNAQETFAIRPVSTTSVQGFDKYVDRNEPKWDYEQGEYSNFEYAYSLKIPEGLIAYHSQPPMPQHGFGIDLSKEDGAGLWVDGSYNTLEWKSLNEVSNTMFEWIRDDYRDTQQVKRTYSRLSKLRAIRTVCTYEDSGRHMIRDEIVALRTARDIVYTLELRTTKDRYPLDVKILNSLQQTFRLEALPEP